jgi:hypothetical protein
MHEVEVVLRALRQKNARSITAFAPLGPLIRPDWSPRDYGRNSLTRLRCDPNGKHEARLKADVKKSGKPMVTIHDIDL